MAERRRFHHRMAARTGAGTAPGVGAGAGGRTASTIAPVSADAAMVSLAPSALTSASVRRSLFQSHLTRRAPHSTAAAAASASATASSTTVSASAAMSGARLGLDGTDLDGDTFGDSSSGGPLSSSPLELLERDLDGELQLIDPPSPTPDELREIALDEQQESKKERQQLAEAIEQYQRSNLPGQPEDLLEAVRISLRAKVAALAEDNWMYEPEDRLRLS